MPHHGRSRVGHCFRAVETDVMEGTSACSQPPEDAFVFEVVLGGIIKLPWISLTYRHFSYKQSGTEK